MTIHRQAPEIGSDIRVIHGGSAVAHSQSVESATGYGPAIDDQVGAGVDVHALGSRTIDSQGTAVAYGVTIQGRRSIDDQDCAVVDNGGVNLLGDE
ncbi:hypothetical protein D3C77_565850 [compost metagenome]